MAERDYSNYWDDWLINNPAEYQGRPENPRATANPYLPPPVPTAGPGYAPWTDPDTAAPNLSDPNQRPAGNPGAGNSWSWDGTRWVIRTTPDVLRARLNPTDPVRHDEPPPPPPPGGEDDPIGMAGEEPAPFNWTQFNPSKYSFVSSFGPYRSPTLAEAENEPGYQFARDQGRKTLENSAAGRGVLRTGGTLKDILEYGNKFGQQNYQAVDDRAFRNWGANVSNERDTYTTAFDRNYRGEKDSFDALRDSERLTFADQYARWRDRLNSLTQIGVAGVNG